MKLTYTLKRRELFLASALVQFTQPFTVFVLLLGFLIISCLISDVVFSMPDISVVGKIFVFIIFDSIPVVAILVLSMLSILFGAFSQKNKPLLVERTMDFDEELLTVVSENGRSEVRWKALQRVIVRFGYLFLFLSQAGAIIIPRRVFASDREWKDCIELCRSKQQMNK